MKDIGKKIIKWCYGGQDRAFFATQQQAIHAYNSRIMSGLLPLMTAILASFLALSMVVPSLSSCISVYLFYFIALALMLVFFKTKGCRNVFRTKLVIGLFFVVIYSFVTLIGTISMPDTTAVMFIVYLLTVPMLMIAPVHHIYAFLSTAFAVFSIIAIRVKTPPYPQIDIFNGITCLILGFFMSQRVLESRISLLATNEQLDRLCKYDALTGISNRRGLDEYLRRVYPSCETMALAMIDIDNFKEYNDTHGHPCGDAALRAVAKDIRQRAAEYGLFAARFGGEEFVLIGTGCAASGLEALVETIREDICKQEVFCQSLPAGRLTVSIGFARKKPGEEFEGLLKRADDALYYAKGAGKNCVKACPASPQE